MPHFVVLHHQTPAGYQRRPHFDLMLEQEGVLRTWALLESPCQTDLQIVEQLADHRLEYLTLEGPLSGDRGTVSRWDEGEYQLRHESPEEIVVALKGKRLQGTVKLVRHADQRWRYSFSPSKPLEI